MPSTLMLSGDTEDLRFLVYCSICTGHTTGLKICPVCRQPKQNFKDSPKYRDKPKKVPSVFKKGLCYSGRQIKTYLDGKWQLQQLWNTGDGLSIAFPGMCFLKDKEEETKRIAVNVEAWIQYLKLMKYLGEYLANVRECDPMWFTVDVVSGEVIDTTNYGLLNDAIALEADNACEPEFWINRTNKGGF